VIMRGGGSGRVLIFLGGFFTARIEARMLGAL
jgi:hypothetical protein